MTVGSGPHCKGHEMQVYLDLAEKPRLFDPAAGEVHEPPFGADLLLVRVGRGVWVEGVLTDMGMTEDKSAPLWERYRYEWRRVDFSRPAKCFLSWRLPFPPSLDQDIRDQDQLEAAQAAVSDPGEGMANPPAPSRENTPEASPIPVRVVNEAYALLAQGERVTIKAACEKANVNRSHFSALPREVNLIKALAIPDRDRRKGTKKDGVADSSLEENEDD